MNHFLAGKVSKWLFLILTAAALAAAFLSACAFSVLLLDGFYIHSESFLLSEAERCATDHYAGEVLSHSALEQDDAASYFADTNFSFRLLDPDGVEIDRHGDVRGDADAKETYSLDFYQNGELTWKDYTVEIYLPDQFAKQDLYTFYRDAAKALYAHRFLIPVLFCIMLVLTVIFGIFLGLAAGRKADGTDDVSAIHRFPWDIALALAGLFFFLQTWFLLDELYSVGAEQICLTLLVIFAVADSLILSALFASLVTRLKHRLFLRTTISGLLLRMIYRGMTLVIRAISSFFRALPFIWKTVTLAAIVSCVEFAFLACSWGEPDVLLLGWFFERLILVVAVIYTAMMLRRLYEGGRRIAAGQVSEPLSLNGLFLEFREHAENLNHVSDGISAAVEERMRSEHFKTELITNVSHDIKTPLTSIINYVDILSKTDPNDPAHREYLEILARQSARLKKLIADLIEVSKASTGALQMDMTPCEVPLVLKQAIGEYRERLADAGLELVEDITDISAPVLGEGRYLWRIFDNLLGNICKYSMPGTRVYVTCAVINGRILLHFRNISRDELNVSADELMERFVRGDLSRNTEGSGLGLSIARSLCELMKGSLNLTVDGDLFKAVIEFPLAKES